MPKIQYIYVRQNGVEKQVRPASRLPSTYQEVEYIQSSGTQWIDTGLYASNNIQTETKVEVITTNQDNVVFGCFGSGNYVPHQYYHLTPYNNKWYFGSYGGEGNGGTYNSTIGTQYTIVYNNSSNYLNINNSNIVSLGGTAGFPGSTLTIGRRWATGSTSTDHYGTWRYFYFKMYDKSQNKYVRDFVPCYRKSDSVIGMYDIVNNQFYTNAGTGTFTQGPNV